MTEKTIAEGKSIAIISYITIIGSLVALFMNGEKKNEFASFHIRQALGLWLTFFGLGYIVGGFDSWYVTIGWYLFFGALFFFGFTNALTGKSKPTPILGDLYQKIFAGLGK